MEKRNLREEAQNALKDFMAARQVAKSKLISIIEACGGFISTIPDDTHPVVSVLIDCDGNGTDVSTLEVYGIRYDREEGLLLFTENSKDNYSYDTDYDFEFCFADEMSDEDRKHLETAMADVTYFEDFDDTGIIQSNSLIQLLNLIQYYV